jgi:tRNA threonylcarbamoyl adenosine modification protein YeaZ
MPTWLAFDAGSPVTSAAVARDGVLLSESAGESRSGPPLLHHLDSALRAAGIQAADLDGILALSGPGSFTGIRVALATALGFRAALAVRVCALSNLAALALHAAPAGSNPAAGGRILALVDALRDEWFVQEFAYGEPGLEALGEARRRPAQEIAPAGEARLAAHAAQSLPPQLAGLPLWRASALAPAAAEAASRGRLQRLISEDLAATYLRGFTPRGAVT